MTTLQDLFAFITNRTASEEEDRRQRQLSDVRATRQLRRPDHSTELCDDFVKYWNDFTTQKNKVLNVITGYRYDRFELLKRGATEKEKFYEALHAAENAYHLFFNPESELGDQQIIELIQFCAEKMEEVHGAFCAYDDGEESSDDSSDEDYSEQQGSELEFKEDRYIDDDDDSD